MKEERARVNEKNKYRREKEKRKIEVFCVLETGEQVFDTGV